MLYRSVSVSIRGRPQPLELLIEMRDPGTNCSWPAVAVVLALVLVMVLAVVVGTSPGVARTLVLQLVVV